MLILAEKYNADIGRKIIVRELSFPRKWESHPGMKSKSYAPTGVTQRPAQSKIKGHASRQIVT